MGISLKSIKEFDVKNKKVLVRCDFNVALGKKGEVQDDFRIKQTLPTIKYLLQKGAKIILMSHLDDPEGKRVESLRLTPIQKKLEKYLGLAVIKTEDSVGRKIQKQVSGMKEGQILLLENLRFYNGEKKNDSEFAKELAKFGDFFINDAFSVCHRSHASIVGIPKYLPSAAGFLLEREVKILSRVLENPWRPLVVLIGGIKISTKIKLIRQFLEKADHVLIGGKIANDILTVKGICVGSPWPEEKITKEIESFALTSTKLHLPVDVLASSDDTGKVYIRVSAPAKVRKDELLLDIGPETINIFSNIINQAKMIVWSGPMGFFENPLFENGTKAIAEKIARAHKSYKIVGGGDTLLAISKFGLIDKFDYVSTGGGAMLSFLSGEELPGLKVLAK